MLTNNKKINELLQEVYSLVYKNEVWMDEDGILKTYNRNHKDLFKALTLYGDIIRKYEELFQELKNNNSSNFEIKVDGITLCRTANLLNDKKEIDESAHSFYKTAITDLREKLKKDNRYIANMEWTEDQVSEDLCLYITTNPLPLERHKNAEK